ncbi:hypothetical protein [Brevundimonas sp.]|uniref:hypothetical protein n=1 Tax=Brevundimonas sp. TaxID=1871086 RepID=UPI002898B389|nr:hypothetical protein [Brevundimonas sp.]
MTCLRLCLVFGALGFVSAAPADAQSDAAMVTITVDGDRYYTLPHSIMIEPDVNRLAQTRQEVEARRWRATRTSDGRIDRISSDECPALRAVALSFGDLPAVPIAPLALRAASQPIRLAPTMKDGFATRLEFRTEGASGAWVLVQIKQGWPYDVWGHEAVSSLLPCWGGEALIPPPSPDLSAADILPRLDLTSFRNSTGPARAAGLKRPGDWGFTELETADGVATLARPGDWAISLSLIRWTPEGVIACFTDRARNGGSYAAQSALRIVSDGLAGYRVADEALNQAGCPALSPQD